MLAPRALPRPTAHRSLSVEFSEMIMRGALYKLARLLSLAQGEEKAEKPPVLPGVLLAIAAEEFSGLLDGQPGGQSNERSSGFLRG
jgi:hypothetical protein